MSTQGLTALTLACAIVSSLTGCGSGGTSVHPVPVDVYVVGQDGTNAVYWKNGVETVVAQNASANAIAVSGADVYVGGSTPGPNGPIATIWKDGTATILSSDISSVSAIAVANGNVYAVGNDQDTDYAVLWTNGMPTQLLDGMVPSYNIPDFTWANSIFVSGLDVYVAGIAQKYFEISSNRYWTADVAVYWKNGVAVDLSQVSDQSPNIQAMSIAVSGSDVYVAGTIYSSPYTQGVYWKNGAQVSLDNANFKDSYSGSIAVSGSNVYVAGNMNHDVLGYWTNQTPKVFSNTSATTQMQIAVNGTDVYVAGDSTEYAASGTPPYFAAYWKNGTMTTLTPFSEPSSAAGIALVPKQ